MTEANPIVTLKAKIKEFGFNKLRAKDNKSANSGEQAYKDINRMDFIINGENIDRDFVDRLYKKHISLVKNNKDGEKNYRSFAKEVFKEMFQHSRAEAPNDHILEELATNCNQAGYEHIYGPFMMELYEKHKLFMNVNSGVERKVYIDCKNPNSVKVECKIPKAPVKLLDFSEKKICDISFSMEFTLESQNGKEGLIYRDGKLLLDVPEELKNYQDGDKSLFDIIREYFEKFCKILGFTFATKIEHNLGNELKVDSHGYLENVEPPVRSNNHAHG
ncbi:MULTISPECIES: hypothetical protein [unclassified Wolbachia]|uniref:hypothetical protein n=1 Tax=unclassified Wolbachia TaxID=2640676 RepID=UPI002226D171|nr:MULTISPECIES: hypothetical protein [unclassified Wolbachia]